MDINWGLVLPRIGLFTVYLTVTILLIYLRKRGGYKGLSLAIFASAVGSLFYIASIALRLGLFAPDTSFFTLFSHLRSWVVALAALQVVAGLALKVRRGG